MPRLPIPGSDDQTWGEILNEFLMVEHNDDGTLKAGGSLLNKYTKPPAGIPEADLASAVRDKINSVSQDLSGFVTKTTKVNGHVLSSDVTVTKDDIGLSAIDNTSDANKPVSTATQAALDSKADTSDLSGGLATKADAVHSHAISQITNLQSSLDTKYNRPASGIPQSDLSDAVQTKLDNGGVIVDGSIVTAKLADNVVITAKITDGAVTKQKLSMAVQTSLDKADSALQTLIDGSVTSPKLADDAVQTRHILDTAVTKTKLSSAVQASLDKADASMQVVGDGSITSMHLADNSVISGKILDEAVTKAKLSTALQGSIDKADTALQTIADGAIGTAKLADNAVTTVKITDAAITETKLSSAVQSKLNQAGPDLSVYVPKTTTINGHALTDNVAVTKADVNLGNVDNTSDINKPISNASQAALDAKAAKTYVDGELATKQNTVSLTTTGTGGAATFNATTGLLNVPQYSGAVTSVNTQTGAVVLSKADVGLGNVDNSADINKPISNATQTALDAKAATNDVTAALAMKASPIINTVSNTSNFTAVPYTKHHVDATAAGITVTLPASSESGAAISVQKSDNSLNLVSITGKINGIASSTTELRTQYQGKLLQGDGTGNWNIIAGDVSVGALDSRYTTLNSAQTIVGAKTFSASPIVPTPTNPTDAVNKSYADQKVDTTTTQSIAGAKTFTSAASFTGGLSSTGLALNAASLTTDTTTGLRIGTATTQKLGFFNATPVQQQSSSGDLGSILATYGLRATGAAYTLATSGTITFSGAVATTGNIRSGVSSQTAAVTLNLTTSSEYQMCNATTAAFNVTLPSTAVVGYRFTIKKIDASVNAVTIVAASIDGVANYVLAAQYKFVTLVSGGASGTWFIVGNN